MLNLMVIHKGKAIECRDREGVGVGGGGGGGGDT